VREKLIGLPLQHLSPTHRLYCILLACNKEIWCKLTGHDSVKTAGSLQIYSSLYDCSAYPHPFLRNSKLCGCLNPTLPVQSVLLWSKPDHNNTSHQLSHVNKENRLILFFFFWMEASRCAYKRNIILKSVRQHSYFITQGMYIGLQVSTID